MLLKVYFSLLLFVYESVAFVPPSASKKNNVVTTTSTSSSLKINNFFNDILGKKSDETSEIKTRPKVEIPKDFVIPEPKPLTLTRPSEDLPSVLKSSAALAVRLATTAFVLGWKIDTLFSEDKDKYYLELGPFRIRDSTSLEFPPKPEKNLILYEYDGSPFCKRVRETINLLDLTVEYRPCPGARQSFFSQELKERTGRQTVPYLIDPNTNAELFESDDQIEYLLKTYGPDPDTYDKKALWPITFKQFSIVTSTIASLLKGLPASQRQENARPDNEQMIPLELWGYECSPFVAPVREKLCSLALPHVMVSCSRGSKNRDLLIEATGNKFQVPFIRDPNTGIEMFESPEICDYLDAVYTVKAE